MAEPALTVLVIDDTEANRYSMRRILERAGFAVLEAATGADGLRRLAEARPDLVILDIGLPDVSGHDVCRRIKGDPVTAAVPVLQVSVSLAGSDRRAESLEGGADGYVTYPFQSRELVAHVQALLRARRAEQAAREQSELLRVTLASIGDAVIAADGRGLVTFLNPVAERLTGWSPAASAVGRPLAEVFCLVPSTAGDRVSSIGPEEQTAPLVPRAEGRWATAELIARDGTHRSVDGTASPIHDAAGNAVGSVVVFRDISERKHLERELKRRADELAERDRRKDEFLAMLAHELRNPLAPVRNALQVLGLEQSPDPVTAEMGSILVRQVHNLVRLVDDLLDVSRITQGKVELRKQPVELGVLAAGTVESQRPLLEQRRHRLELSLPSGPVWVEADPARLEQVLSNLLNNAAKYTPEGGHIRVALERSAGPPGEAVLRVRDNGIGIAADMQTAIFDIFQQADRVPGRVSEGLGLGLTLVRNLMELHGGTVEAHSAGPGQGSEFIVRLPLRSGGDEVGSEGTREGDARPAAAARKGLRVLVVEDNVDGARSLGLLLRLDGHEVRAVHDGPAALVEAAAFRPEVVLLDIGLPRGMDGYEVARRLRQLPGNESAFLVALTGFGQEEDRQRSSAAGFDAHLVKPVNPEVLHDLLGRRRPRQ